ncbi:hypothetical protein [Nisaea sp.]
MSRLPVIVGSVLFLALFDSNAARSECVRGEMRDAAGVAVSMAEAEAGCDAEKDLPKVPDAAGSFGSWIRVSSAKYGSADQWCSGRGWVARICNGRDSCTVSLPYIGTQWSDSGEHTELRRELICGPLSKVQRLLYIGWYCSDGALVYDQPEVVVEDGGRAVLSCSR